MRSIFLNACDTAAEPKARGRYIRMRRKANASEYVIYRGTH